MARRYSTLGDVIDQLKENNNTQLDTTDAVDSLTNVLSKQFVQQNKEALEARRESGANKAKLATTGSKNTNVASGNKINLGGGLLGGLGVLIGGAGVGIGAAAAGLGAFFTMLAKADSALPNGGENVKKLLTNTAEGLAAFQTRDLKAFGALLGAGALFGAVPGLSGIGAGIGIGAVGVGLAAFFTGLAGGDMAIGAMESTAANLKIFLTNLGEGLSALNNENFIALGGLMAAGGALGALFGVGKTAKTAIGMGAIGAGIAAFLTPLAGLDALGGVIGSNGSNLGGLLKNIAEGLGAFDAQGLAAMTGLFAAGAIFGAIPGGAVFAGKAVVGLGAVGFGLGAFLLGLAGAGKLADFIGVDGSGISKIMKNVAIGMNELAALPSDIGAKVKAVGFLGPAIAALYGGQGLGQLLDFAVDKLKSFSNFIFGTDFKDQATSRKNMMKSIVDSIMPLKDLDMSAVSNLDKLSNALGKFSTTIGNLSKTNLNTFKDQMKKMIGGMKLQLDLLNAMAKGGKVGSGYFDGIPEADFKKGFLDPTLKIDELSSLMNKTQEILNKTNINYRPTPNLQSNGGGVNNTSANNITDASTTTVVNNNGGNGNVAVMAGGGSPFDLRDPISLLPT